MIFILTVLWVDRVLLHSSCFRPLRQLLTVGSNAWIFLKTWLGWHRRQLAHMAGSWFWLFTVNLHGAVHQCPYMWLFHVAWAFYSTAAGFWKGVFQEWVFWGWSGACKAACDPILGIMGHHRGSQDSGWETAVLGMNARKCSSQGPSLETHSYSPPPTSSDSLPSLHQKALTTSKTSLYLLWSHYLNWVQI